MGKRYRYLLQLGEAKNPLLRNRAWQLGHVRVDPALMREAAQHLEGTHDFAAFRSADDTRLGTVRTLWSVAVLEGFADDSSLLAISVHGNAFMKNMVRILAGTLVAVGDRWRIDWDEDRVDLEAWVDFKGDGAARRMLLAKVDPDGDFSSDYEDLAFERTGDCTKERRRP